MLDVLLVNAATSNLSTHSSLNPPLGLGYIASVLIQNRYRVSVLDVNVTGYNPRLLEVILKEDNPSIIGISAHTETYCNGLAVSQLAKELCPDIKTIMGGTHPSIMYDEVAKQPSIDVVVIGEGEYTMLDLCNHYLRNSGQLDSIEGIAFKRNGQITRTRDRPFIADPDELPFPARGLFPMPFYKSPGQVLSSRGGCPYNCYFCAVNNIWKGGRRFRKPENVINEILNISRDFDLDEISFADDAFTMNRNHVMQICELSKQLPFNWRWKCATRVDLVDIELLEKMHQAGCYSITFGVEAGSQKVLDAIGKKITLNQVMQAVNMTKMAGISVLCAFMFPHPYDTEDTIRAQKDFIIELKNLGVVSTMSFTTPFPGTYYYDNREELGINIEASSWDEYDCRHLLFSTRILSKDKLNLLLREMVNDIGMTSEDEWSLC